MARILIIEDEPDLNDLIARQLRQEGHDAIQAFDGPSGLALADVQHPDLVVLDWLLPGLDGLTVCRRLRERSSLPILMVTARDEEADVVLGLEVGADDYLTKPFRMRELLARVRSLLRRIDLDQRGGQREHEEDVPDVVHVGPITVSAPMRQATIDGIEIELTPKEFDLLLLFATQPGRAFSREYLLERVWSNDYEVTDRTVDTHVQRLRKKLGANAELIRTVWGVGYKLHSPSSVAVPEQSA